VLPVGGGYRLKQKLGSGAFGDVYRAIGPAGTEVAVKWMASPHPQTNEACRLEKESLEAICQIQHPHLLRTWESHVHNGRLVLIMDLAECSLTERLQHVAARA